MQNFEINSTQIDKIKKITTEEKSFRIKNLEFFKATGFPNKRFDDFRVNLVINFKSVPRQEELGYEFNSKRFERFLFHGWI